MKRYAIALALAAAVASLPLAVEAKGCPPGLVKKSTYCMPPGQAQHFDLRNFDIQNNSMQDQYQQPHHHRSYTRDNDWNWQRDRDWHSRQRYAYPVDDQTKGILNLLGAFSGFTQ